MLEWLRKSARSPISVFFLSILVAGFAILGFGNVFQFNPANHIAVVGGRAIAPAEFERAIDREIAAAKEQFGQELTREQAKSLGIASRAVQTLIESTAIDVDTANSGIIGSKKEMLAAINGAPAFKDAVSGQFSVKKYQEFIRNEFKLETAEFEKLYLVDLARQANLGAMRAGIVAPRILLDPLLQYAGETRDLRIFILPVSLAGDPGQPKPDELRTFYTQNPRFFARPERRRLVIASFDLKDFLGTTTVSEEEIRQAFEARKKNLGGAKRATFEQAVFPNEEAASKARRELTENADFAAIARTHGGDSPARIEKVAQTDLSDALWANAVFAAKPGAAIGPFKSGEQWLVGRLVEFIPAPVPTLEAFRTDLMVELRSEKARVALEEALESFEDARGGGTDIVEAAEKVGALVQEFVPADAQGIDSEGNVVVFFRDEAPALRKAFELASGETSDLFKLRDDSAAFIKVEAIEPAGTEAFEKVETRASEIWRARKRGEAMEARAAAFTATLKPGANFTAAAQAAKAIALPPAANVPRGASNEVLSAELSQRAFAAATGEVVSAAAPQDGSMILILVEKISPPDLSSPPAYLEQAVTSVRERVTNDAFERYRARLRETLKEKINQTRLDEYTKPADGASAGSPPGGASAPEGDVNQP